MKAGDGDDRVSQLERRIQSLERGLARTTEELSKIQSSRWWRAAGTYWRLRAEVALLLWYIIHPTAAFKLAAQRLLPVRLRMRLLKLARREPPLDARLPGEERELGGLPAPAGHGEACHATVLFLPAVPWSFRRQRPQHLAVHLAALDWPVAWVLEERVEEGEVVTGEDLAPGVRGIRLPHHEALNPLSGSLEERDAAALGEALARWRRRRRIHEVVVMCESPYWARLAERLKQQEQWPLIYDLIDLHQGFSTTPAAAVESERSLLSCADVVTATSADLERTARLQGATAVRRIPNACDWRTWSNPERSMLLDSLPRPIVGYFGAISEWFDNSLVEFLAASRPHWSFVLIGSTWGGAVGRLEKMSNVHLLGEQPYESVPSVASSFDVAIIPFRDTPLTRATDPVKAYEMLALGLKVVATALPEFGRFENLIDVAGSQHEFLKRLDLAVRLPDDEESTKARQGFAKRNGWEERAIALARELRGCYPRVSIAIVTYNNIPLTRLCLASVRTRSVYPNYEVIVVDNGSTDGTQEYLEEEASGWPELRVVLNESNRGFAAANNQAFRCAEGEILALLNNDTVVTRGWLCSMVRALMGNPSWGLVGAVTNAIGNEARITTGYKELSELDCWAEEYVWRTRGKSFPIGMVALFCAGLRRDVWERVGELDERFEVGMFEDDDYSRRVRQAGYEVRCLRDCFVHHWHQASFRLLGHEKYQRVFEANRKRFLEKWSLSRRAGIKGAE